MVYAAIEMCHQLGVEPEAHGPPLVFACEPARRRRHLIKPAGVVFEPMGERMNEGHDGQRFRETRQPITNSDFQRSVGRARPQIPPEILQRLNRVASYQGVA